LENRPLIKIFDERGPKVEPCVKPRSTGKGETELISNMNNERTG
jgi:hypothetical protein